MAHLEKLDFKVGIVTRYIHGFSHSVQDALNIEQQKKR